MQCALPRSDRKEQTITASVVRGRTKQFSRQKYIEFSTLFIGYSKQKRLMEWALSGYREPFKDPRAGGRWQ